jgi:two-component system nitrogen regulation sensor histidine kinase NtrY
MSARRRCKTGRRTEGNGERIFKLCPDAASQPSLNHLNEIVRETLVLFQEAHKEVDFKFVAHDLPTFNIDRDQMKRVMINLLDNAVAAVTDDGEIRVTVSFDEILKIVRVEVADNGPGIPAEDKIRMFEPYFSTKEKGSGLGLAISHSIVDRHGGRIGMRSQVNQGSTFTVRLPVRRPQAGAGPLKEAELL